MTLENVINFESHLCPLEMKFICLTLLIINGITDSRSEQYEVVGPADPVLAVSGEDVILPCSVKPNISVVDMRVEWFRLDLKDSQLVHLHEDHEDRNTDQIHSYRGRTELIHQELQRGNASLKLSSVRVSDEGLYKCFIQSKSWYDDTTVNVSVEAVGRPPVITVDGFDHSGGLHLQCESEGWHPEPDLEWLNSEGVSLSSENTEKHRNTDGFSVKQTITVHHIDKYHCRVKLRHHMLEAQIITTSKTWNSWRMFVICVSVTVAIIVIAGILKAVFDAFKKNRVKEYSQLRLSEMRTMRTKEKDILDLENEKTKMQADLEYEKTRMQADILYLKNVKTRMQADLQDKKTRMKADSQNKKTGMQAVISHVRTHTVNVTLDADTAHPCLIVSDDGKQVKIGNSKPNEAIRDEEQNTQPKEEEIGDDEHNTKPKEEEIGNEDQNTKPKEEEIGDEEQNTKLKEEIGDEEQNTQPKEKETGDEEHNTKLKEEIGDEEQNTKLKEEEIGDEEQDTKLKEEEIGDEEQNTKLKEDEMGDEEQNTKLKEEKIGDEEKYTQLKEKENGDAKQNTQPKEEVKGMKEQNDKFEKYLGVLGKDGFSSGSFYYEVQVKGQTEWDLGVTTESVNKKELFSLNSENRCWTVSHRNKTDQVFGSPFDSFVSNMKFEKVGVFVDCDEGLVSFYDVESMSHIHSYTDQCFNEKLYPFFGLGLIWNENTAPLIISPVKLKKINGNTLF